MRPEFERQLRTTGYIHGVLTPDVSKTAEVRHLRKEIIESRILWNNISQDKWFVEGKGNVEFLNNALRITAPTRADSWPEGAPSDGDYAFFGQSRSKLKFDHENWQEFNRISFKIRPECNGMHSPLITVELVNDGCIKIPDIHFREGFNVINLKNCQWNDCVWEFPELPRDAVTEVAFCVHSFGGEVTSADLMQYDIKDILLEQVIDPDVSIGWQCRNETISYSTTGYWLNGTKTAIAKVHAASFNLLEENADKIVFTGAVKNISNSKGDFSVLDFSEFKQVGRYRLQAGEYITESFEIGPCIMEEAVWKVIHFLYAERCGYPVVGRHGSCHGDIIAEHLGTKIAYNGGWHDAGDVSQQTAQTAEVVHALLEMAESIKNADTENERLLYTRLLEEAQWGLDFVLRMRFGDGYRASSAGICRWTNGLIGDMDDAAARVHNFAFENFLMAGIEAYGAIALKEQDTALSWKCLAAAKQDYQFAQERFETMGIERPIIYEHTYNSGLSQYYATASWAASLIYKATEDQYYAQKAEHYTEVMLQCQETGTEGIPFSGFFYRDASKKTIIHFNHQSREQIFVQALDMICRTQPDNAKCKQWEAAMKLYGKYIKDLMKFSAPYSMIPAGVHAMDEVDDEETFPLLHLHTSFENERENYIEQLKNAIPINEKYCVKCFPVWFSFRGNTAIHLSAGKAASLIGRYFKDNELLEIAREQLYWVAGKNPFGQSLIYGEGSNYAQQYGALAGEMVGEIPVGIQTKENQDIPFWPMACNATYKEVWTTSASRWLWVLADVYSDNPGV